MNESKNSRPDSDLILDNLNKKVRGSVEKTSSKVIRALDKYTKQKAKRK